MSKKKCENCADKTCADCKRRKRSQQRKLKDKLLRDLGLTKVRGAKGGIYWE